MDGWNWAVLQCYSVTVLHYQRLHNETPLLLDQLGNTVDQYNQEIQLEIQNETRLFDPPIQFTLSQIFITIHPGTYVQLLPKKTGFWFDWHWKQMLVMMMSMMMLMMMLMLMTYSFSLKNWILIWLALPVKSISGGQPVLFFWNFAGTWERGSAGSHEPPPHSKRLKNSRISSQRPTQSWNSGPTSPPSLPSSKSSFY